MLRLVSRIKRYEKAHYALYALGSVGLLWAISDAIISYYLPIHMSYFVNNLALIGLIFSTSSLAGAIIDIPLGLLANRITYKPIYIAGCLLTILMSFLALSSESIFEFIILMIIWGIYYEAISISSFSFIVHKTHQKKHSESSGIYALFISLGYVIGPLIAATIVVLHPNYPYFASIFFALLSIIFIVLFLGNPEKEKEHIHIKRLKRISLKSLKEDLSHIRKFTHFSYNLLVANFLKNFWSSLFWVIGPIFMMQEGGFATSGTVASLRILPFVLFQGVAGYFADKYGKYKIFLYGLLFSAVFTILFGLAKEQYLFMIFAFLSSVGFAIASPAINGIFADYATRYNTEIGEIAGLQGIALNLGYIAGPAIGGISAYLFGMNFTFVLLGIFMLFYSLSLFIWKRYKYQI